MADLLQDLYTLGFWFAKDATIANEQLRTELALREFQTYARLKTVAVQVDLSPPKGKTYADCLQSVDLPASDQFTEVVTGSQTPATMTAIDTWRKKNYRCPVVVECWRAARPGKPGTLCTRRDPDGKAVPVGQNIWLRDDPNQYYASRKGRRMFVRDFSKRYDGDPVYQSLQDGRGRLLLGSMETTKGDGPISAVSSREVAIQITPDLLTGNSWDKLDDGGKITYRVVRAVSEAECTGYFDSLNCWDQALVSLGPCHWTIAHLTDDGFAKGEFEAFLAYTYTRTADLPKTITGETGVAPLNAWGSTGILNTDQRKYESQFSQQYLNGAAADTQSVPADPDRLNFFRSWHWFYRFQTSCRTSSALQTAMWDMARFRLRDIRSAPAGHNIKNGGGGDATLGDVFTSEQSMIFLMEWHVYKPGEVFSAGKPAGALVKAMQSLGPRLGVTTDKWGDDDENKLIAALKKQGGSKVRERFDRAFSCRQLASSRGTGLTHPVTGEKKPSAKRNSFVLDKSIPGTSPF